MSLFVTFVYMYVTSFFSGGVTLSITGRNLHVVQEPRLGLTLAGRRSKEPLEVRSYFMCVQSKQQY